MNQQMQLKIAYCMNNVFILIRKNSDSIKVELNAEQTMKGKNDGKTTSA